MGYKTAALALALAFVTSPLVAQDDGVASGSIEDSTADGSFGLGNQDLFVPAFAFQPIDASSWEVFGAGYFRAASQGGWLAPVTLPAGARITVITCYFFDDSPAHQASASLIRFDYNTQSDSPSLDFIHPAVLSADTGGYHRVFESYDETVRYRPSTFTRQYYGLQVSMPPSPDVMFRGCNITWNRQVSPAPTSATFTDVPVGHPYRQFIEALVDSGITAGCGGGLYCVNAPITRGEMAVFLAAALGLHFPN